MGDQSHCVRCRQGPPLSESMATYHARGEETTVSASTYAMFVSMLKASVTDEIFIYHHTLT